MRSAFVRTCFGYCALSLCFAACSSSQDASEATGGSSSAAGSETAGKGKAGSSATKGSTLGTGATGASGDAGGGGTSSMGAGGDAASDVVVGKPGGTVTHSGVTLVVPPNALPESTPITVTPISAPDGFSPVSDTFQFGPDGTQFAQPVTVTIPLATDTPDAHVFWSNADGGFDDIGGMVSGASVTAQVTHFSIGFAARPIEQSGTGGAGGMSSGGGDGGVAGAADVGGSSGAGGSAGTSAGGSSGTSGSGGAGGASLCAAQALNLPFIKVTNTSGSPPDSSGYVGGTLASGTYLQKGDTHYGAAAYSGPAQAQYKIDTTAMTIQIGERVGAQTYYVGMTYTQTDAHTLHVTLACDTSGTYPASFDYDYTAQSTTLVLTLRGSSDILTF